MPNIVIRVVLTLGILVQACVTHETLDHLCRTPHLVFWLSSHRKTSKFFHHLGKAFLVSPKELCYAKTILSVIGLPVTSFSRPMITGCAVSLACTACRNPYICLTTRRSKVKYRTVFSSYRNSQMSVCDAHHHSSRLGPPRSRA